MRAPEITEDNFEDLLAIDDVLLDYFNTYLALPVFSQTLYYNRLTGTFLHRPQGGFGKFHGGNARTNDVAHASSDHVQYQQQQPPYGATEEENERMIQWAKDERLPMFFRTRLFREYKLCRLLLRSVDDRHGTASVARARHSAAAGFGRRLSAPAKSASSGASRRQSSTTSSLVRGYSRQTAETCSASSLSNSAGNSGAKDDPDEDDVDDDDTTTAAGTTEEEHSYGLMDDGLEQQIAARRSALFRYLRPGSGSYMLPLSKGPTGGATVRKSAHLRNDVKTSQLHPMATVGGKDSRPSSASSSATKPGKQSNADTINESTNSSQPQPKPSQRPPRRRLETSSEQTDNDNMEFSEAMTSAFDESLDSEAMQLIWPEAAVKLRLKLHTDKQHMSSDSATDSSTTEFPAIVTPRRMRYYDVVYEDVDNEQTNDTDALMMSAAFAGDVISEAQTEEGVRSLEAKHRMSLQGMKELVLGSASGMANFRQFLQLTVGRHLYDFWLDCEFYKETVEDLDDDHHRILRSRLFKDIQEKYKLSLTREAVQQFMYAASHFGLKQMIFTHAQYSVLRRLRAYWVPRYLIHLERINQLGIGLNIETYQIGCSSDDAAIGESVTLLPTGIFPSVNVVHNWPASSVRTTSDGRIMESVGWGVTTLIEPALSSECTDRAKSADVGGNAGSSRQTTTMSASAKYGSAAEQKQQQTGATVCHSMRDRFLSALRNEKEAGGPLQLYLQRCDELDLLCNLLFWQEITDYQSAEAKSSDKAVRASHSWDIFTKYISKDAFFNIGLPQNEREKIHRKLQAGQHLIKADVFVDAQAHAERLLEEAWIGYVKQDFKTYLDCGLRTQLILPTAASDFEVKFDVATQQLIVEAIPETRQDTGEFEELRNRVEMTEAQKAVARRRRLERRKVMERERRKAIKAAKIRLKEAKMKARGIPLGVRSDGSTLLRDDYDDNETGLLDIVENPTFHTALVHKGVMSSFKKHLSEVKHGDEVLNAVSLFTDIEAYNHISGTDAQSKKKKDELATYINRQYLLPGAKKKFSNGLVSIPDWTPTSVKDRPKSPVLRKLQAQLQPTIDSSFTSYCLTEDFNSKFRSSASKSQQQRGDQTKTGEARGGNGGVTLPVLLEASPSPADIAGYNPFLQQLHKFPSASTATDRHLGNKSIDELMMFDATAEIAGLRHIQVNDADNIKLGKKLPNRVHPTKADKSDFHTALQNAASGHLPVRMWLFYEFLVYHGEIEGNPRLDKNLFFYCEVLKFKEASHMFADEELLRRKVQSMSECYIEPAPNTVSALQIDIATELQQKVLKAVQKYLTGKDYSSTLFDEALPSTFKEMLPYWVVFNRSYLPPSGNRPIPLTKQLRDRRKKLEEILRWSPQIPQTVVLPLLTKGTASSNSFTYSLSDGFRWKNTGVSTIDDRSSSRGGAAGGKRTPLGTTDESSETATEAGNRAKKTSSASRVLQSDLPSISNNNAMLMAEA